jgi:hypothetical protein
MCLAALLLFAMGWSLTLADLWSDFGPCGNVWSHPPFDECNTKATTRLWLVLVIFVTPAVFLLLAGVYRLRFGTGDILPKDE